MAAFVELRILSDLGNDFWSNHTLLLPTYMFLNLTVSLAASVKGASSLSFHVYAVLPTMAMANILFLTYFVPVLGSIHPESQNSVKRINKALMRLEDADRRAIQILKRRTRALRPFGFRLGIFSFISLNTAQEIITNSISHSLLIISLD